MSFFAIFFALAAASGCASDGSAGTGAGDPQTPPTISAEAIGAWIDQGAYRAWHCEAEAHAPRDPSPHGKQNRICSNDLLSTAGAGEYPIGAASVKELVEGGTVTGHAVYVKDGAGAGPAFLWYERLDGGVVAFGHGDAGKPLTVCVGCHSAAGPDHFGHDLVFTQVR